MSKKVSLNTYYYSVITKCKIRLQGKKTTFLCNGSKYYIDPRYFKMKIIIECMSIFYGNKWQNKI